MAKTRHSINVNRMVGEIPLIGSLTPIQLGSGVIAFFLAYVVYANTGQLMVGIAIWVWIFFTLVLVLGKHHWQFLNKFRSPPRWSRGRNYYFYLLREENSRKP
jgi:hypothetical protein